MDPYETGGYYQPPKSSTEKYTVKRGDTLSKIAKDAGISLNELKQLNPKFESDSKYKGGNLIFAGTKVNLPGSPVIPPVKKGDGDNEGVSFPPPPPPPPPAEPITPSTIPTVMSPAAVQPPPPPVKTAPIDTVLFDDEGTPIEVMTDLIFENIGGHELINIARNDIVNGQQVSYQPIKNLSSIQQQYNPNNIISLQSTSDKYFANFSIKLENKIPQPGTGPNGAHVYLDQNTGNMIVEAINLESDEQIQVEITTSGTIYEAEFGEITS
jgi:LysM repeat protein